MKLKVYTVDGSSFSEKEFEAFPVLEEGKGVAALKQAVVAYQANLRQGNAKTKDYGEVAGSGKKQGPQKGSGGARHGDKRAPPLYKGGVVFGPRPRDWSKALPAKIKKLALSRALVDLAGEGGLNVIERIESADAKTKTLNGVLEKVFPTGKLLVVADAWDENAARAIRNIARVSCVEADAVNALNLVSFGQVLVSEQGLNKILERVK